MTLRPWLSTRIERLRTRDALLDDWGIHHFHLGAVRHKERKGFVARTDEVAFAMVRPDAVYFLVATSHNRETAPLVWTQTQLVDMLHRHWPDLMETPTLRAGGSALTAEKHAELRRCRVNAGVTVSDGTVYYPPGGGVMSNGDGGIDFLYQMQLLRQVEYLETAIQQREVSIRAMLGLREAEELELKARFQIDFPEGFAVDIHDPVRKMSVRL